MGVNANSQVDGGVALGADSVSNRQQTSNAYIPSGADTAQVNAIKATKERQALSVSARIR